MNRRSFLLGLILLASISCVTLQPTEPIDIYQKTQSYKKYSFDHVWSAALKAVDDVDFVVRNTTKRVGLVQAVAIRNPEPRFSPPRMNVIIKEENGRIEVNFHIELPGQKDDTGKRRKIADRFFKVLRKNLR